MKESTYGNHDSESTRKKDEKNVEQDGTHVHRKHKPCQRCRTKHLKCVYPLDASTCQRCQREGEACTEKKRIYRFRDAIIPKYAGYKDRRIRLTHSSESDSGELTDALEQDVTASRDRSPDLHSSRWDILQQKASDRDDLDKLHRPGTSSARATVKKFQQQSTLKSELPSSGLFLSKGRAEPRQSQNGHARISRSGTDEAWRPNGIFPDAEMNVHDTPSSSHLLAHSRGSSLPVDVDHNQWATIRSTFLDDIVKGPLQSRANDTQLYLETVLLRYFQEEVAPWFDICDPNRHFVAILPYGARIAGPLRSAMLTLAARTLSHNSTLRSQAGTVKWNGHNLTNVTEELAISYHNQCIHDLMELALHQERLLDVALLTAVVILRTDEEMQREVEDQQLFLKISNLFIDAQLPPSLANSQTSPSASTPVFSQGLSQIIPTIELNGLRRACLWTSLRQDIHATLLTQQPVKFPLSRCEAFRSLGNAPDDVWTTRMVVFCADVLEFCYGSDSVDGKVLPAYDNRDRWQQLRGFETSLCSSLPDHFGPTYCREPNQHEIFPSIFYLTSLHISGTTYMELARMLLEVFNPTRPSAGLGCMKALKTTFDTTRKILYRLCGIAINNSYLCPPSLVNASLGIALFGEYVEVPVERGALLDVLTFMTERHHYFPAARIAESLLQTWGSGDCENALSTLYSLKSHSAFREPASVGNLAAARAWKLCTQMLHEAATRIGRTCDDISQEPPRPAGLHGDDMGKQQNGYSGGHAAGQAQGRMFVPTSSIHEANMSIPNMPIFSALNDFDHFMHYDQYFPILGVDHYQMEYQQALDQTRSTTCK